MANLAEQVLNISDARLVSVRPWVPAETARLQDRLHAHATGAGPAAAEDEVKRATSLTVRKWVSTKPLAGRQG